MTKEQKIAKQENRVEAYREEFHQNRIKMEESRKRAIMAKARLQDLKARIYFRN